MPIEIGARVGAIRAMTEHVVELFGYGVFEGNLEHPEFGFPNPRLKLDDGRTVWGAECWWGGEEAVKQRIEGKRVVRV